MSVCPTECCLLLKGGKEGRFVICCPRERNLLYNEDLSKVLCVPAAWVEKISCNIGHANCHTCLSFLLVPD
jgi:hypothetical protein